MKRKTRLWVVLSAAYMVVATGGLTVYAKSQFDEAYANASAFCQALDAPLGEDATLTDVEAVGKRWGRCLDYHTADTKINRARAVWLVPATAFVSWLILAAFVSIVLGAARWVRAGKE